MGLGVGNVKKQALLMIALVVLPAVCQAADCDSVLLGSIAPDELYDRSIDAVVCGLGSSPHISAAGIGAFLALMLILYVFYKVIVR